MGAERKTVQEYRFSRNAGTGMRGHVGVGGGGGFWAGAFEGPDCSHVILPGVGASGFLEGAMLPFTCCQLHRKIARC